MFYDFLKSNRILSILSECVLFLCLLILLKNCKDIFFQKEIPLKLAIVDGTRIKKESKVFLKINELEKQAFEKTNNEIREKYKILQNLLKSSKNPKNSAKVRQKFKKQFEAEFAVLEPQIQKKKEEFREKDAILKEYVHEAIFKITGELAKKYKLDVILNADIYEKKAVFYASSKIDLTDEVIAKFDEQLENVVEKL
ncbi:MAG: OmpH family outer membrane protein [Holosporales bacterium]|jgi:Skp family chaperone for outer membrane proteins|nr:OmpH family outer membrane protein [Holosporales bacterium]